jgi:hypothetical protein
MGPQKQIDFQNNVDIENMLELEQMFTLCSTEKDRVNIWIYSLLESRMSKFLNDLKNMDY